MDTPPIQSHLEWSRCINLHLHHAALVWSAGTSDSWIKQANFKRLDRSQGRSCLCGEVTHMGTLAKGKEETGSCERRLPRLPPPISRGRSPDPFYHYYAEFIITTIAKSINTTLKHDNHTSLPPFQIIIHPTHVEIDSWKLNHIFDSVLYSTFLSAVWGKKKIGLHVCGICVFTMILLPLLLQCHCKTLVKWVSPVKVNGLGGISPNPLFCNAKI